MKSKHLFLLTSALAIAMTRLVCRSFAADGGLYQGDKWTYLDPKVCLTAAAEITAVKYPDSDDAVVEQRMVRDYHTDGSAECQDETYQKVLTEKGKRGDRTMRFGFMLPYNTVEVVKLEIIKPNGEIVPVDIAKNSKEMIDESQMSMNIYDPNSKILQVNIPQLEVGEVIHSIVRTTIHRAIIPGEYSETSLFEAPGYIRHAVYEVHAPAAKPLKHVLMRDEIPGTVHYTSQTLESKGTIHHWEVNNVSRMFDEPGMPPYANVLQRLAISTTPDWQAVSKWYWELSKPHLEATTPEMKKKVEELTAHAKNDQEKVEALFHYVSRDVRYMGLTPEKDRPGFEPHDVKITFENKYGVCRDKAALLVSMLRLSGLPAYPLLVNVGTKMDSANPDPGFNHAIVAIDKGDGKYTLMDPTAENTKDLLPSYECDQSFLVCRPEGENLKTSEVFPADENLMRVKTEAVLNASGTVEAKSKLWFGGINDNEYREAFSHMKPDDQRRFFERSLKRQLPGVTLKSLKITPTDMADVTQSLQAELEFSVPGMTAEGGGKAVVNMPWIGNGLGLVGFILGGAGLETRKYPLRTQIACGLREDVVLKLSPEFTNSVSMPTCVSIDEPKLAYTRRVEFKDQSLIGTGELKLKGVEFTPSEYKDLKRTLQLMEYDQRKAPIMATLGNSVAVKGPRAAVGAVAPVESNSKVIESRKSLEFSDAHTSTFRIHYIKQVLTYAGKKTEAEVKLEFNPSCQQARVVKATVTSKSGQKQEISGGEINVMDAGWNASAKRYTGGKILVANLPGVDLGSTIDVELEITSKGHSYEAGFEAFQLFDDLAQKSFTLIAPADLVVGKLLTGPSGIVQEETSTTDGRKTTVWRSENVHAMAAEPQRPPEWAFMPGLEYFVGDMSAYLTELNTVMKDRSGKNEKTAELARKLAVGAKSKLDTVLAIRDFVSKSIRRAGPTFTDLPLNELTAADTTLVDGYGHAADEAILLHSLLQAAGFTPEFVLASGLPAVAGITNVAMSFPLPQYFNTPLVRVKLEGETYYLNDTDQYARLGSTAHQDRLAIALNTQAYEVIFPAAGCKSRIETDYKLTMSDDGKTRIGITRHFYGSEYGTRNRFFSELPPEERRRYFQERVSEVVQGARPVSDLTTKFDSYPGVESFTVEMDSYSVADGRYFYFDLPFTPSLYPGGSDQRSLPFFIAGQSDQIIRTEIDLPPAFRRIVISPENENLKAPSGGGFAKISSKDSPGKRIITHHLEVAPALISPVDYASLVDLESTLGRKSSKVFLLEKE